MTDIFAIRSTSDEAKHKLKVDANEYMIVEWQAIVGRLYAKAARFRKVTNKHAAWKKADNVRTKVNTALKEYQDGRGQISS